MSTHPDEKDRKHREGEDKPGLSRVDLERDGKRPEDEIREIDGGLTEIGSGDPDERKIV